MCCIYIHFVIDCLTFALYKHCRENCSSSQWCMHAHSPPALVPHRVKKCWWYVHVHVWSMLCHQLLLSPFLKLQVPSAFCLLCPNVGIPCKLSQTLLLFFLNSRIKLSVNAVVCVACEHQFGREMACTVHMLRSNFTNKSAITERQW